MLQQYDGVGILLNDLESITLLEVRWKENFIYNNVIVLNLKS